MKGFARGSCNDDEAASLDDETLVRSFKASGDAAWFGVLYRRHRARIYACCLRVLGNNTTAEDLTHDTFMQAFRNIHQYEEQSFQAWLTVIARRYCIDYLRSAAVWREAGPPTDFAGARVSESASAGTRLELDEVIEQLPHLQRLCINLHYRSGFSYKEIMALTGLTENDVKTHIQNGKRRFRQSWSEETT